ncbi:MAG TPA: hypothetical protein DDW93_11685, partial [Firmicutes bacterium]|nr:hypothetical protein [Bacillota bacterium]
MSDLTLFYSQIVQGKDLSVLKQQVQAHPEWGIYADSLHEAEGTLLFMVRSGAQKNLVAVGDRGKIFRELVGEEKNQNGLKIKVCALTVENSQVIRRYFDFT